MANAVNDADELADDSPALERSLGVWQATALNVSNMVGIGPFITIPAFLATMQGPQALIGEAAYSRTGPAFSGRFAVKRA